MATNRRPWKNGVRQTSVRGEYEVRPVWRDHSGQRRDTIRRVVAASASEALAEKERLEREFSATSTGWTVKDAIDALLDLPLRYATKQSWTVQGGKWTGSFGDRPLATLAEQEIRVFLAEMPGSDVTAKCARQVLVRAYEHAIETGKYTGANTARMVRPRKTRLTPEQELEALENPRRRAMTADETSAVLAELSPDIRTLATIQLLLGCRFSEVSALRWQDVDLVSGVVSITRSQVRGHVSATKAKRKRSVRLPPEGIAALESWRERMTVDHWPGWQELVFPKPPTHMPRRHNYWDASDGGRLVREAQQRAGVDLAARTHAWRHTHVTAKAAEADAATSRALVMASVGHASEAQHLAYVDSKLAPESSIASVGRFVGAQGTMPRKH